MERISFLAPLWRLSKITTACLIPERQYNVSVWNAWHWRRWWCCDFQGAVFLIWTAAHTNEWKNRMNYFAGSCVCVALTPVDSVLWLYTNKYTMALLLPSRQSQSKFFDGEYRMDSGTTDACHSFMPIRYWIDKDGYVPYNSCVVNILVHYSWKKVNFNWMQTIEWQSNIFLIPHSSDMSI